MFNTIKITNNTKGVLVLADLNNANHINLLPNDSKTFFEYEFKLYERNMQSRLSSGLLKKEVIQASEPVLEIEAEIIPEIDIEELAGIEEEVPTKKKKKSKNKKFN